MQQTDIITSILTAIETHSKSNIDLSEIQSIFTSKVVDYYDFAQALLQLETDGRLIPVKSHGRNGRNPSLAYRYRIEQQKLRRDHIASIQAVLQTLYPLIKLDTYYRRTLAEWKHDLPRIQQINEYLTQYGIPEDELTAPERSFALTGDEKWIDEQGGRELLEKLGLWASMRIISVSDPLMLAIHPMLLNDKLGLDSNVSHLIVENKATFHALLNYHAQLSFATLIYGSGNKIIGNLRMFDKQVPLQGVEPLFYYFGDLDWEGIRIWHRLDQRYGNIRLAIPFYTQALQHEGVPGKANQRQDYAALDAFCQHFPNEAVQRLSKLLSNGHYIPQEVLSAEELYNIGRGSLWNAN